ncbi:MAG: UDP-2,3-diacylglucosamine diphosphatase [Bacteroidota bacterium]
MEENLSNHPSLRTKIYFASDFHLGVPSYEKSLLREKAICAWMDEIRPTCQELFLVGDIFDFWFEYKHAIPKGFVRLQGKIASFTDAGIPVHIFTGNHDMWIFDYIPKELGVSLHRKAIEREFFGKIFLIGHGDGLGPGDLKYKFLKKFFDSKICQWLFARFHPNFGIGLANYSSRSSRKSTGNDDEIYHGDDKEFLVQYCKEKIKEKHYDYFIFGHRHLPLNIDISEKSKYINLGDWIKYYTYGEFSEKGFDLKVWETN